MLCENCHQRPANVHVTRIVNADKTEMHLCSECAREMDDIGIPFEPGVSMQNVLAELLNYDELLGRHATRTRATPQCSACGLTYQELTRTGLMGCAHCYEDFAAPLQSLLQRIHGAKRHGGKLPRRRGGALNLRREMEELRQRLDDAISAEEYERAATLRDEIHQMEKELGLRG